MMTHPDRTEKKILFFKWILFVVTVFWGYVLFHLLHDVLGGMGEILWLYVGLPAVLIGIAAAGCPKSVWPTLKEIPDKVMQTFAAVILFLAALLFVVFDEIQTPHNIGEMFFILNGVYYLLILFIWQPHVFGRCHKWIKRAMMALLVLFMLYVVGMMLMILVGVAFNENRSSAFISEEGVAESGVSCSEMQK